MDKRFSLLLEETLDAEDDILLKGLVSTDGVEARLGEGDQFAGHEDLADDGDLADDDEAENAVSREFLRQRARGLDPFCQRPWRTLKVTLNSQTRVCCDFFTQLPAFDFPTARDFHKPTGMWNHPFMQHMRRSMGKPEEVPFCTLCLTKDKRSPHYADLRAKATAESVEMFRRLDEVAHNLSYKGRLGRFSGDLERFSLHVGKDKPRFLPFKHDRAFYRRLVVSNGFTNRGRVLMYGAMIPAIAPFLAEACDALTVADPSIPFAKRATKLCEWFGLDVTPVGSDGKHTLDLESESFDAIWVNAQHLNAASATAVLAEMRRLLAPSGIMRVYKAAGPGKLLEALATLNGSKARLMSDLLEAGPGAGGFFFSAPHTRAWLRRFDLRLDNTMPIAANWSDFDPNDPSVTASENAEAIRRFAARYLCTSSDDATAPKQLKRAVTFSCFKR